MVFGSVWIQKGTRIDLKKLLSKSKKTNILIVGGTGFIGRHLIKSLSNRKNFEIISLSKKKNQNLKKYKRVKYFFCDISNKKKLYKLLDKFNLNIVVNLGGHVNHSEWKKTYDTHYKGCQNLANYYAKKNISKFIQLSSSLEYGNTKSPHQEKKSIFINKLKTAYSIGKAKSTQYLINLNKSKNFPVTILRLYLVYGPDQDFNRIIPITINKLLNGKKIELTSCEQIRDFLYIDDLIRLVNIIIFSKNSKELVFNVGSGKPMRLKTVIEFIKKKIKKGTTDYGKLKLRKDENLKIYPNINLVKKVFNWYPKITLQKGLIRTINFYKYGK